MPKTTIKELQDDFETLNEEIVEALLNASEDILKDIEATHKAGQSPDGKPWKARQKAYPWPINIKSGHLLNSYEATPNQSKQTITISNNAAYADYVDNVRPILPTSDIPVKFVKELQDELDAFIDEWNSR